MIRAALTAVALLVAAAPGAAKAATFQVTRTDDPSPSACAPGTCSLRGAVLAANANGSGDDSIALPAGTYRLTQGELLVTGSLTLAGAGSRSTTIDAGGIPGDARAVHVAQGAGVTVNVGALAITGGHMPSGPGGGIFVQDAGSTLNLFSVAIAGNAASSGGGVQAAGTVNALGSLFSANRWVGGTTGDGAGIAFTGAGRGAIVNSTFVGNHGPSRGGAIDFAPTTPGTLFLLNDTLSDNHADGAGGGIDASGAGSVSLKNSIVSRNTVNAGGKGPNCLGSVSSAGHNLEGAGDSCGLKASGDLRNTDPKLGRTGNHGGPTDTRDLQRSSPAIDAGTNSGCPATDQRGVKRPQGKSCDIGAYELAVPGGGSAPRLSHVRVTKRMKRGVGVFSYTLSEAARVTITLHRGSKGRRVRRKCVKPKRSNRGRRSCTRYKRVGKLTQSAIKGRNRKRFKGKIGRKRLKPGSYRATLVARSSSGVNSKPIQVKFKVVK